MGVYDDIEVGDKVGQVKCWDSSMHTYKVGDRVPDIDGQITYSIAMREGGYVNVEGGLVIGWTDRPRANPVFDKYGSQFDPKTGGVFGEKYVF